MTDRTLFVIVFALLSTAIAALVVTAPHQHVRTVVRTVPDPTCARIFTQQSQNQAWLVRALNASLAGHRHTAMYDAAHVAVLFKGCGQDG